MAILIPSDVRSPMAMPYARRMCCWIAASSSNPPTRRALPVTTPPMEITAISDGPHRHDVGRGPPDHVPRVLSHREDLAGPRVHGDDGGFVEHDAVALPEHQRVRGAEVDGQVLAHLAPHHPLGIAGGERLLLPDRHALLDALDATPARPVRVGAF